MMIYSEITEARADSRNTDPGLTRRCRIGATAAVASVGASTPGELIVGFIAKELVGASAVIQVIKTSFSAQT